MCVPAQNNRNGDKLFVRCDVAEAKLSDVAPSIDIIQAEVVYLWFKKLS